MNSKIQSGVFENPWMKVSKGLPLYGDAMVQLSENDAFDLLMIIFKSTVGQSDMFKDLGMNDLGMNDEKLWNSMSELIDTGFVEIQFRHHPESDDIEIEVAFPGLN